MKRAIIALVILFALVSQAMGANGNDLLPKRNLALDTDKRGPYWMERGYCVGFVEGVLSTSNIYKALPNTPRLFCFPPAGVSNEQMIRVVVKYLENHPEQLHFDASILVLTALKEAFPCKE